MDCILGIDQGSSNTRAAVMDLKGNILSYHRTGGSYFRVSGIDSAMEYISAAAGGALNDAGISIEDVDMVVAGVTGIDWIGDDIIVSGALKERFGDRDIIACNDCEIAYYSGSMKPAGAVICAGTGINAALFSPDGSKFVMGDYLKCSIQGGSAIAKSAVEAVIESDLGVLPETRLTKLLLDYFDVDDVYGLLQKYMTADDLSGKVVSLAPRIIELADDEDKVAQDILALFADNLCACFLGAMKKMDMLQLQCDIVLAGSILRGRVNGLTLMITERLLQTAGNANIVNAGFEPVVGACIMGYLKKSADIGGHIVENVTASAGKLGLLRISPSFI